MTGQGRDRRAVSLPPFAQSRATLAVLAPLVACAPTADPSGAFVRLDHPHPRHEAHYIVRGHRALAAPLSNGSADLYETRLHGQLLSPPAP